MDRRDGRALEARVTPRPGARPRPRRTAGLAEPVLEPVAQARSFSSPAAFSVNVIATMRSTDARPARRISEDAFDEHRRLPRARARLEQERGVEVAHHAVADGLVGGRAGRRHGISIDRGHEDAVVLERALAVDLRRQDVRGRAPGRPRGSARGRSGRAGPGRARGARARGGPGRSSRRGGPGSLPGSPPSLPPTGTPPGPGGGAR